jgi:SAM-dependent methyltransferase
MNEERHWNAIAPRYNEEIFDVFKTDKKKKLKRYVEKHANARHTAIDFGCGTGKAFNLLAPSFRHVVATDISDECLDTARRTHYTNISFRQQDLTNTRAKFQPADFLLCVNVAILPELEQNLRMFRLIRKSLKKNGHAVMVIPSLESVMHAAWRMMDWYKTEGVAADAISDDEFEPFRGSRREILQGIIQIDRRKTKHYTATELEVILTREGLKMVNLDKIEYPWSSEFDSPPEWMQAPYPWDWLVECRPGR